MALKRQLQSYAERDDLSPQEQEQTTSSSVESYELKVQNHLALFELMPYKTWGSSDPAVKRGKPHPDIFIVAANKFPDKPSLDK
ncbi:2-deoxyglucose-6-phosphate phosphatase, partial [Operophtera brumata]